jgi:hypothetical protein
MMSSYAVPNYQLIRGVLAAHATGVSFCVLRCRLQLLTWQELAAVLPQSLQKFLAVKYGIAL